MRSYHAPILKVANEIRFVIATKEISFKYTDFIHLFRGQTVQVQCLKNIQDYKKQLYDISKLVKGNIIDAFLSTQLIIHFFRLELTIKVPCKCKLEKLKN